jgi:acetone carboxylase gamma subunit
VLSEPKTHHRFQEYLNQDVIGASADKVDWHLQKTLTKDLKSMLEQQSQKVLKYICR